MGLLRHEHYRPTRHKLPGFGVKAPIKRLGFKDSGSGFRGGGNLAKSLGLLVYSCGGFDIRNNRINTNNDSCLRFETAWCGLVCGVLRFTA